MDGQKKQSWKNFIKSDMINMIAGALLIVSLIFVYQNPYNKLAILTASAAGGLMNIISGLKTMKDTKRKTTGMTFLLMGVVLFILGLIITQYFMQ